MKTVETRRSISVTLVCEELAPPRREVARLAVVEHFPIWVMDRLTRETLQTVREMRTFSTTMTQKGTRRVMTKSTWFRFLATFSQSLTTSHTSTSVVLKP
jgi:hypothetical protein